MNTTQHPVPEHWEPPRPVSAFQGLTALLGLVILASPIVALTWWGLR